MRSGFCSLVVHRTCRHTQRGTSRHSTESSHHVGASQRRVSVGVLLPVPATSSHTIVVGRCSQYRGSSVHLVALGLLQLSSIRHLRRLTPAVIGRAKCRNTLDHYHPKVWPHYSSLAAATLLPVQQRVEFKIVSWSTSRSTTWHHGICQTTVNS